MSFADFHAIAEVARTHRGIISISQLRAIGVGSDRIERLARSGYLRRTRRRGVFSVGFEDGVREARWARAVAMSGSGAALSHVTAAQLHGITRRRDAIIDVTVPKQRRSLPNVRHHRLRPGLPDLDPMTVHGIVVTRIWPTVSDLSSMLHPAELVWSIKEAMFLEPVSTSELLAIRDARFQRAGAPCLREAVTLYLLGHRGVDSVPELSVIEYLTSIGIEPTCINVPFETSDGLVRPDLAWPELGLAFEVDGRQHGRHPDRRRDAERSRLLGEIGMDLFRATAKDVRRDTAAALAALVQEHQLRFRDSSDRTGARRG